MNAVLRQLESPSLEQAKAAELRAHGRDLTRQALAIAIKMSLPTGGAAHWFDTHPKIGAALVEAFTVAVAILAVDIARESIASWPMVIGTAIFGSVTTVLLVTHPVIEGTRWRRNRIFEDVFGRFRNEVARDMNLKIAPAEMLSSALKYPDCRSILTKFWKAPAE